MSQSKKIKIYTVFLSFFFVFLFLAPFKVRSAGTWTQDTQSEFKSGVLTQTEADSSSGYVKMGYYTDLSSDPGLQINKDSNDMYGYIDVPNFDISGTAYIKQDVYLSSLSCDDYGSGIPNIHGARDDNTVGDGDDGEGIGIVVRNSIGCKEFVITDSNGNKQSTGYTASVGNTYTLETKYSSDGSTVTGRVNGGSSTSMSSTKNTLRYYQVAGNRWFNNQGTGDIHYRSSYNDLYFYGQKSSTDHYEGTVENILIRDADGTFTSQVNDFGEEKAFPQIDVTSSIPSQGTLEVQVATSPDGSSWTWGSKHTLSGGSGESVSLNVPSDRYAKVRFYFSTTDAEYTPSLNSLSLHYETPLYSTSNSNAPAGAAWIEGSDLHWADGSTEYWLKDEEVVTTSPGGPNGALWIEESYLHWIDANGDERRYQGPVHDSSPGGPNGAAWLEGNYIHYIDSNGDERITDGT